MSSVYGASEYDWAERRPDKPLVVKCNLDGTSANKRITFPSSRTCTYDQLRRKVDQCFSLSATPYMIKYTDDDGETTDITTDTDLTEAIHYFHPGSEDPPLSSTASILSGRSFGRGKITLRVKIHVDYDGPSLSDTSSLVSMEEYRERNGSEFSLSFSASSVPEFDDDSVTVSSKDMASKYDAIRSKLCPPKTTVSSSGSRTASAPKLPRIPSQPSLSDWDQVTVSSAPQSSQAGPLRTTPSSTALPDDPSHSTPRLPDDPALVFERLKIQESFDEQNPTNIYGSSPLQTARGAEWLRDQNARTLKSMLGSPPASIESDQLSLSAPDDDRSIMSGELALQKDPRGKFYYAYTSGTPSSAAHSSDDSGYDDSSSVQYHADRSLADTDDLAHAQRPLRDKSPINRQGTPLSEPPYRGARFSVASSSSGHHNHRSQSEPILSRDFIAADIPPELLPFISSSHLPPPPDPTDCSNCGVVLETFRYVCSTCGEKKPRSARPSPARPSGPESIPIPGKGKEREVPSASSSTTELYTYPPRPQLGASPNHSSSSWTLVADENPFHDSNAINLDQKPLPALPSSPHLKPLTNTNTHSPYLAIPGSRSRSEGIDETGYELCGNCIQSVGVNHALESLMDPGSSPSPGDWPPSPEEALQLRRTAPKKKGQLRHAYLEKIWGVRGWDDVVQDDVRAPKCSTCNTTIVKSRYKCASCGDFSLCRACYSQVHEIHPSHAFLDVPEKPPRSRSEPSVEKIKTDPSGEEPSMVHPGVKCAHCMRDIVGARFHCAICASVDICSNCEAAGLPGNLDDDDGGHSSSHIMIKIPYPLPSDELQIASSKAKQMWDKDAPVTQRAAPRSRRASMVSSHARTVLGAPSGAMGGSSMPSQSENHGMRCDGCTTYILGARFQCANCPSKPKAYNLCYSCEGRSYVLHDPMHVFFKLPRRVDKPIESDFGMLPQLYRAPAGPPGGTFDSRNPKAYLQELIHTSAVCDRCMTRIQGEWFRCVYCGMDLCDTCEGVDTHDTTHFFMVFKGLVDMHSFRSFALNDNGEGGTPVVAYPVYLA